jgi:hypothetical protein
MSLLSIDTLVKYFSPDSSLYIDAIKNDIVEDIAIAGHAASDLLHNAEDKASELYHSVVDDENVHQSEVAQETI